ncbi:MAG: hydrogenase expression/formation protein HypE [bacterium]
MKKYERIMLAHGSGGQLMHELIDEFFVSKFSNPFLNLLNDQAQIEINGTKLAFTTDSFVVNPLFFPGGDIGRLAVFGTVNDLSVGGAIPKYISLAFIIEEGFLVADLEKIVLSIKKAAIEADVQIVTGDTKVVNKGAVDKIFINTAGIGFIPRDISISVLNIRPGDKVIVSGTIGDHGIAIMAERERMKFEKQIKSDLAPLNILVQDMLAVGNDIHAMRDPTRGGLGTTLNEFAKQVKVGIIIDEESIPLKEEVAAACELFGLDPLYSPCEGRLIAIVPPNQAEIVLETMRKNPLAQDAALIGEVVDDHPNLVRMKTRIGGMRIVDMLVGEQLPRIC